MSLGIVIKGTEGLVLAAESRVTLTATPPQGPALQVNFDNATKLLSFGDAHSYVGAVTYGVAAIGLRTAHSFIPEFEASLPDQRLLIDDFAQRMSQFFIGQWQAVMPPNYQGPNMTFVIGGFNDGEAYGRVFEFNIPGNPNIIEHHGGPGNFGITWGGQREFVDRVLRGYDYRLVEILVPTLNLQPAQVQQIDQALQGLQMQIPLQAMALQDCVDLAIFFLRTTIGAQRLTVGIRGCGGPIDVATITRREGLVFVQKKEILGEREWIE
jgi:hypothetical protein